MCVRHGASRSSGSRLQTFTILSIPYLYYILRPLIERARHDLAVYLISHCRSVTMHPRYIGGNLFKSLPHVRRVTLLYHSVYTWAPFYPTWCFNLVFPQNVEQLDMLFSFDQEPCHRFYSKNHYYRPEFYSPNSPNRFNGHRDYESRFNMPHIRHLAIYGANPAMVILTIELFPVLKTLQTDIDSTVLEADLMLRMSGQRKAIYTKFEIGRLQQPKVDIEDRRY